MSHDASADLRMDGHTVVITGGARNTGVGIAEALSATGAGRTIGDLCGEKAATTASKMDPEDAGAGVSSCAARTEPPTFAFVGIDPGFPGWIFHPVRSPQFLRPAMKLPVPLWRLFLSILVALTGAVVPPSTLEAQEGDVDPATLRWVFNGEISAVLSRGNSETGTVGFGANVRRVWEQDKLLFEAGWIRVETGTITRTAVGSQTDFTVERTVNTERTAENMFARGRYDRRLNKKWFAYGALDWMRNTFAGIDSRYLMALGGGTQWIEREDVSLSSNYAFTYSFQEDVVENPFLKTSFPGARLGFDYRNQVTASTEFTSRLVADQNLSEGDDRRVDFLNALTVDINDILALKPSLLMQWRDLPSLTEVPLFTSEGTDTGQTVLAPLRNLDTTFTLALVLSL